jgi:hypothetical protein
MYHTCMSISFHEEEGFVRRKRPDKKPTLTDMFINKSGGLLKNETQASVVMLAMALIFFVTSISIFITFLSEEEPKKIERLEDTLRR